jgi:MoxR-like ATPase
MAARANAFLDGRGYVTPGDIKRVSKTVLRHRLVLTYEADAEGFTPDTLVARLTEVVPAP